MATGFKRVRNGAHPCGDARADGSRVTVPPRAALLGEWDLGGGWSATRHSSVPGYKWVVGKFGFVIGFAPTLKRAAALVWAV